MAEVERLEEGREEGDRPVGEVASQHPGFQRLIQCPTLLCLSPNFFIKTRNNFLPILLIVVLGHFLLLKQSTPLDNF